METRETKDGTKLGAPETRAVVFAGGVFCCVLFWALLLLSPAQSVALVLLLIPCAAGALLFFVNSRLDGRAGTGTPALWLSLLAGLFWPVVLIAVTLGTLRRRPETRPES